MSRDLAFKRLLSFTHLLRGRLLLWSVMIDGAAVLRAPVSALPVLSRGVHLLEEGVQ